MDWFSWKGWVNSKKESTEGTELKKVEDTAVVVEHLKTENEKLRKTVDSLLSKFGSGTQVGKVKLENLPKEELENLQKLWVTQNKENITPAAAELSKSDPDTIKLISEGELGQEIKPAVSPVEHKGATDDPALDDKTTKSGVPTVDASYKNAVFVKSAEKDEVAVVDMKNVEWWTLVNPDALDEDDKDITTEASELGDSFAVIQQDDVTESMANFLAVSIERNPDAKQLSPAELRKVLDGTLAQARRQGKLTQAYGWGMWLYSSYSWGSYVVRIYKEPTLVKLVLRAACVLYNQPMLIPVFARGLWSAASWALIAYL